LVSDSPPMANKLEATIARMEMSARIMSNDERSHAGSLASD
jgi:hypothetical protein